MTNFTFRDAAGSTKTGRSITVGSVELPVQLVATGLRTILDYGFAAVTTIASLPNIQVGATHAFVTVESGGGDLRWRSGANATALVATPTTNANAGLRAPAGSAFEIALIDLTTVRVIAVSGTASIVVEYAKVDS